MSELIYSIPGINQHFLSEVARAGLRLLKEREERKQLELEALRAEIAAGQASGSASPSTPPGYRLRPELGNLRQ